MKSYLAIDIGASSGRHIVGWRENGFTKTDEVYRFPNGVNEQNGHLTWDIESLVSNVKEGIARAKEKYPGLVSLAIDTWGVDYVLMKGDKAVLPVYAYRDSRTEAVIDEVHRAVPFSELYSRTGIQYQPFNTIYQLYADKKACRLEQAADYLMIPEYLMYRLCGVKVHEYTNATTTGMVSALTGDIDRDIVQRLGLPEELFTGLSRPGRIIGEYSGIKVVLCATHDTGSAVEGIPMEEDSLYISSGTWSLLGAKTSAPITNKGSERSNYSNEGGVGYNRYQKNIMGLWLINELRRELCPEEDFAAIVRDAEKSSFDQTVDANSGAFLAPASMKDAFDSMLSRNPGGSGVLPVTPGDYFRCAYRSLAESYGYAVRELEQNTGKKYKKLYIVGGGAKNDFLNNLTAKATGKEVVPLPIEATALGNLKIQMEADL